MKQET